MTNSMIPYSFVPGTKAKADEVNANFIALAETIESNRLTSAGDIEELNDILDTKADKTELINEHTVTESNTDLNNYKTKGTYIFSATYKPDNIPKGSSGMLIVTGDEDSVIKQIWFCQDSNPEIYTRDFSGSTWTSWYSHYGILNKANPGYLKLSNGLILQWGYGSASGVYYPVAYTKVACPIFSKQGYGATYARSDTGFVSQTLTSFSIGSSGVFSFLNWIAIGY